MDSLWTNSKEYKIKKFLGKGGGGEVYLGYDLVSDPKQIRPFAIKFLNSKNLDRSQRQFFSKLENAKIENIPRYYGLETFGDKLAMIFDYIEGQSLQEYLVQQKSIRWEDLRYIVKSIVIVLAELGERGLYHGDLKLDNIMLDRFGQIKILDLNPDPAELSFEYTDFPTYQRTGKGVELDLYAFIFCIKRILKKVKSSEVDWEYWQRVEGYCLKGELGLLFDYIYSQNYETSSLGHIVLPLEFKEGTSGTENLNKPKLQKYIKLGFFVLLLIFVCAPKSSLGGNL